MVGSGDECGAGTISSHGGRDLRIARGVWRIRVEHERDDNGEYADAEHGEDDERVRADSPRDDEF